MDTAAGPELQASLGEATRVEVDADGTLRLVHGGVTLLTFPLDGFELGLVDALDDTLNYDPYYLEAGAEAADLYSPPATLRWVRPEAITASGDADGVVLELALSDDGGTAELEISQPAPGRFALHLAAPEGSVGEVVMYRLRPRVDPDEGFYGLGEVFDTVEHRGALRAMQFEPSALESAYNEAHVPVPLLIGTTGWGLFVASYRPGVFAMATEEDDLVQVTFGQGAAGADGLDFHLFAADHPLSVTRHYYEVTGYPGAIAPHALGPWIWRDEVEGQVAVEEDLATIRDLDLATTGYWIDRPYASAVNSFDFQPSTYEDPAAMFEVAADLGFAMALWHTPYLDEDDADSLPLYEHAVAEGYYPPSHLTPLGPWGPPIDFSNPEAFDWWQGLLQPYVELGVVGYKLDYAEETLVGGFGLRLPASFADGTDELTMHRRYQMLYHQVYAETLPAEGGFLLCRSGAWGDQVHGTIVWPGDIDANMVRHGEETTDPKTGESYIAVGGLPAAVIAGSSLGPSGFPFFGSDTGGYRHSPPDRETYVRWFQHTALSTVMQVGTNTNDLPWAFGDEEVLDEEMLGWYRDYARLHLRLWPYLWSYVKQLAITGEPIQRPLGLAYPELGVHPDFTYLLGAHLLVAAVVDPGVTQREVTLPAGEWVDWWTGERHDGAQTVMVPAPLERIPLLVRAGAPVPLLRETIDTLEPVADPANVDSFDTQAGPLVVRVARGGSGEFELYDGTVVAVETDESGTTSLSRTAGTVFDGAVVFELFATDAAPIGVAGEDWTYDADAAAGTVRLTLAAGQETATLSW